MRITTALRARIQKRFFAIHLKHLAAVTLSIACTATASAQWLQWGGPNRDFKVEAKGLAAQWPADGPKKIWERDLGDGYSAILADNGTLYTMFRRDADEIVIALSAKTGETIWEYKYETPAATDMVNDFGGGPRGTPLLAGDRLFTVGIAGRMHALDRKTGKKLWEHDLLKEYGGNLPNWGYSSSPLAYKNMVIVPVGGTDKSVMAFKQDDGSIIWSGGRGSNAYSSPILAKVGDQEQIIMFMANGVNGLNPDTGAQLWNHPHKTNYDVNAALPVWGPDNLLFVNSGYETGGRMLQLTPGGGKTGVKELWYNKKLTIQHSSAIRIGDTLYGSVGGGGPSFLVAVDVKTGKERWRERGFAKATLLYADDKLIILDEDGQLGLATATPEGLKVHSKHQMLQHIAWTVPTLTGTTLYARDRQKIVALDLKG